MRELSLGFAGIEKRLSEFEEEKKVMFQDVFQAINCLLSPHKKRTAVKGFSK